MTYLYHYLVCLVVIFFVGLSLRTKPWVSLLGAVGGAIGYLVYLFCSEPKVGVLLSAFVLAVLSEVLARICKMPASIFLVLGIFPLVPGSDLYQMMAYGVQGDFAAAITHGGEAFVSIVLMAVAIAFVPAVFKVLFSNKKPQKN